MDTNSKKYKTILADPPWDINQRGKSNVRSAESHYALMPLDRIKAMPVADLCEDNAHLYLWCPNGLLPEALEVVKAWGSPSAARFIGSNHGSGWEITSGMPARRSYSLLGEKHR